jgi:hypothetical protein
MQTAGVDFLKLDWNVPSTTSNMIVMAEDSSPNYTTIGLPTLSAVCAMIAALSDAADVRPQLTLHALADNNIPRH